ncbi:hypothetical protein QTO31_12820 [Chloroflexus sp. MS-CIW-1]|uniref:hypothetical protein n=1 Tax=Chloroflexus sp. MS-CIW-1 TaxID=3055768 RepID=UPI002647180E|nr:hypothetical protein [Chloroflexus sp. MS-CIW-1]MDN5272852.1 hypothetical protein [Chloroflexus sp. MS-CIW-1]
MTSNGATTTSRTDRLLNASALLERLNEPQTAAALHLLLDKAELLAFSVSAVDSLLQRGETIADNVAASVHELRAADDHYTLFKHAHNFYQDFILP